MSEQQKAPRDMSARQFKAACERHGFKKQFGALGYYELPGSGVKVSVYNCGSNRFRDMLAYLIQQQRECAEKYPAAAAVFGEGA